MVELFFDGSRHDYWARVEVSVGTFCILLVRGGAIYPSLRPFPFSEANAWLLGHSSLSLLAHVEAFSSQ
jgi:hypothetical protein